MNPNYPPIDEPASPDYVLSVLQDEHRQRCAYDPESVRSLVLSFETTVQEWREACDLLGWRAIASAFNATWHLTCSDSEWYDVLEPANQRRLRDVCQLIAARVTRPAIRPARLLGTTCASAGAFLTIRSLLSDAGAPADEITPSTPLAPYTRQFTEVFLGPISRLAPGALPPVRIRGPVARTVGLAGLVLGLAGLAVDRYLFTFWLTIASVALFAASYALVWYAAKRMLPESVTFGDLRTFGDLAHVVRRNG